MKIKNEYKKENNAGFDFMLPSNKNWFSPREVSKILGSSDQYVRNCIYSGKLFAHVASRHKDKDTEPNTEPKSYIRIHRQAIEMYLVETANYNSDTFIEKITHILSGRTDFELMRIEKLLKDILYNPVKNRNFGTSTGFKELRGSLYQ